MRTALPPHLTRVHRERELFAEGLVGVRTPACGRYAPQFAFQEFFGCPDEFRVNLDRDGQSRAEFQAAVARALSKRFYQPTTRRKYLVCLDRFFNWVTIPLPRVQGKVLGCFLARLRENGASAAGRPASVIGNKGRGSDAADTTQAEAPGTGTSRDQDEALLDPDRGVLRELDTSVHPLPQQASSA